MKIMIIGGASGIGLALAKYYLQQGAQIAICGRNLKRIDLEQHANIRLYEFDIADKSAVSEAMDDFAGDAIDMLIVTAGLYFNTRAHQLDAAATMRMLQTNVTGLNNAFELAAGKMLARRAGHLVAISSVAGLLQDYPGASLYGATKRAVIVLCETYRKALAPFSIAVTVIVPGYIDTAKLRELNNGDASRKPFLLSEQQAVEHIVKAIEKRKARHVFPWQMHWLTNIFNSLPPYVKRLVRK